MKPHDMINETFDRQNISAFVNNRYGISIEEWFASKDVAREFFETVMQDLFEAFTGAVEGEQLDLEIFNPYTRQQERFCKKEIAAISSFDELLESLSYVYRERLDYLNNFFYQRLALERERESPALTHCAKTKGMSGAERNCSPKQRKALQTLKERLETRPTEPKQDLDLDL